MTTELDTLAAMQPVVDEPTAHAVRRQRALLTALIDDTAGAPPSHPRTRRRRWLIPAAAGTALLSAAAGWALRPDAEEAAAFDCRADGVVTVLPNDGTPPVDACATAWRNGAMVEGVRTAPPLVACVTTSGTVSVIEGTGRSACLAASMELWDGSEEYAQVGGAVHGLRVRYYQRGPASGARCVTAAEWTKDLRVAFAEAGLEWTIEVRPAVEGRRCYDVGGFDLRKDNVTLVAVPGNASVTCDPQGTC